MQLTRDAGALVLGGLTRPRLHGGGNGVGMGVGGRSSQGASPHQQSGQPGASQHQQTESVVGCSTAVGEDDRGDAQQAKHQSCHGSTSLAVGAN